MCTLDSASKHLLDLARQVNTLSPYITVCGRLMIFGESQVYIISKCDLTELQIYDKSDQTSFIIISHMRYDHYEGEGGTSISVYCDNRWSYITYVGDIYIYNRVGLDDMLTKGSFDYLRIFAVADKILTDVASAMFEFVLLVSEEDTI